METWYKERHVSLTVCDREEADGMRRDDRGVTLVEMIIAISACAIVIVAASLFMRNALRSYGVAEDAINLQIEAQVLMEQLATWVMEGNYVDEVVYDSDNDVLIVYHIPREAPDPDDPALVSLMGERWVRVFWCDGSRNLYMYKGDSFPDPTSGGSGLDASIWSGETEAHLLSRYVKGFTVEIDKSGSGLPNKVTVTLSMKAGIHKYELKDVINIRNASYVPAAGPTETPPSEP